MRNFQQLKYSDRKEQSHFVRIILWIISTFAKVNSNSWDLRSRTNIINLQSNTLFNNS